MLECSTGASYSSHCAACAGRARLQQWLLNVELLLLLLHLQNA
jgi:hypothetical protein